MRRLSFLVVSLCLFVMAGCSDDSPVKPPERWKTPDFVLEDLEGEKFQLSEHQEKVVLLQFFATSCESCWAETSILNNLNRDLAGKGLVVVGIAVLMSGGQNEILYFVDVCKVNYRILLDEVVAPGGVTVAMAYDVNDVPATFIVDREGWIDQRQFTGFLSEEDLLTVIEPLL